MRDTQEERAALRKKMKAALRKEIEAELIAKVQDDIDRAIREAEERIEQQQRSYHRFGAARDLLFLLHEKGRLEETFDRYVGEWIELGANICLEDGRTTLVPPEET